MKHSFASIRVSEGFVLISVLFKVVDHRTASNEQWRALVQVAEWDVEDSLFSISCPTTGNFIDKCPGHAFVNQSEFSLLTRSEIIAPCRI